jgi:hypothetical protein
VFRRTVSLLVLFTGVSLLHAQKLEPPAPAPVKPAAAPALKEPTLDEKIALALKHHPDIRAAEAKRALAEAELEQAKLALSQKIATASAKVTIAREELAVSFELLKAIDTIAVPAVERLQYKKNASIAASSVTLAETELKNLLTMPKKEIVTLVSDNKNLDDQQKMYFKFVGTAPSREIAASLTKFLSMPVVLDVKKSSVTKVFQSIEEMAEKSTVIRFIGFDEINQLKSIPLFKDISGKMTMQAWLQLFVDELNTAKFEVPELNGPYDVYIRDYGLMICPIRSAPRDAMTMSEFIRQLLSEKK